MEQYRDKFQGLLRELFQFDCADLDFGIYRIMNYKRDVIEKFITQDLPKAIADELDRLLHPIGVGVVLEAEHLCMAMRGVRSPGTVTITSSLRGCLKEKPEARAEFFAICRDGGKG